MPVAFSSRLRVGTLFLLLVSQCRFANTDDIPAPAGASSGSSASPAPSPDRSFPAAPAPRSVGDVLPEFQLATPTVVLNSTAALRQGPLVVVFFIGDFCGYCRRQLEGLQGRLGDFRAAGATVWAVSADDAGTIAALARTLHLEFPLGSDAEGYLIRGFGVQSADRRIALPAVFVLTADGAGARVRYRHVGAAESDRVGVEDLLSAVRALR